MTSWRNFGAAGSLVCLLACAPSATPPDAGRPDGPVGLAEPSADLARREANRRPAAPALPPPLVWPADWRLITSGVVDSEGATLVWRQLKTAPAPVEQVARAAAERVLGGDAPPSLAQAAAARAEGRAIARLSRGTLHAVAQAVAAGDGVEVRVLLEARRPDWSASVRGPSPSGAPR